MTHLRELLLNRDLGHVHSPSSPRSFPEAGVKLATD
jgi:hypothetical protein